MGQKCDRILKKRTCCPDSIGYVRIGYYRRKSDSKFIQRWRCKGCKRTFSQATGTLCFGQNKRRVNIHIEELLAAGMTMRGMSRYLKIHRITVARKKAFLAIQARKKLEVQLKKYLDAPITFIQFDEQESFEHSKMKPLSIALAVHGKTREILGAKVSSMPSKGLLAKRSRKKYGPRPDHRAYGARELFAEIDKWISPTVEIRSDQNPMYPKWIKNHSKTWVHTTVKGQRGCIVGGGELKKVKFDPLFSLNHTCAMNRANISRLFRKTWNTTKCKERLEDHLYIYAVRHNKKIQRELAIKQARRAS